MAAGPAGELWIFMWDRCKLLTQLDGGGETYVMIAPATGWCAIFERMLDVSHQIKKKVCVRDWKCFRAFNFKAKLSLFTFMNVYGGRLQASVLASLRNLFALVRGFVCNGRGFFDAFSFRWPVQIHTILRNVWVRNRSLLLPTTRSLFSSFLIKHFFFLCSYFLGISRRGSRLNRIETTRAVLAGQAMRNPPRRRPSGNHYLLCLRQRKKSRWICL